MTLYNLCAYCIWNCYMKYSHVADIYDDCQGALQNRPLVGSSKAAIRAVINDINFFVLCQLHYL